jgi:NDP-sugar pyrophosphorylase family protein
MTIYDNAGKYDTSNVEAIDGRIMRYDKRNRSESMRYIDYGLGVFNRSVFEDLEPEQTCDLADVYQGLLAAGELACFEVSERFYEAGSQAGLLELAQYLSGTNPAAR